MLKPLLKWPGGKSSEIDQFLPLIPEYDRYIEPFVGGGALFFRLNPEKAVINDTSEYLMELYRLVGEGDEELHRILNLQCRTFSALQKVCADHSQQLLDLFHIYEAALTAGIDIKALRPHLYLTDRIAMDESVVSELILDREEYAGVMAASFEDKLIRTAINHRKKPFSEADLRENLITGFTSGYYLYQRNVFNEIAAGKILPSRQLKTANFYFIREYCYGSMFRYNKKGEFNIPYGGMSYNKKDLSDKTNRLFSPQMAALLKRTEIYCEDFETLLDHLELTERDFLFLDPPYDTEFSDYEGHSFGKADQCRLADFLTATRAQFLLVIKNTEFIYNLYDGRFRIMAFENKYLYNMRSRNDRKAQHLIITNIPEGEVPWIRENINISDVDAEYHA